MFTGLIEEISQVSKFNKTSGGAIISLICSFTDEVKPGDSICINGACLTVIDIKEKELSFEISKETLDIANFSNIKNGDLVNVERAIKANGRLDGHIVSGHIDGTAKITNIIKDGFSFNFEFETSPDILKYIVRKGSIAVNGISLTITKVEENSFNIEIIPHTIKNTNLNSAKIGDTVNIETDITARYIEKFLYLTNNKENKISMELLKENGYL